MAGQTFRIRRSSRARLENSCVDCNGLWVMISCYHLPRFDHAICLHVCHPFLWHFCPAGAAKVRTRACADSQGWERVRCRLNFIKIWLYQKVTNLCFFLFASFASLHLHFLVFLSWFESNPSRLSGCKCLLINLVARDFIIKPMVLFDPGRCFLYYYRYSCRKMRHLFFLSFVSSNTSYMIIHGGIWYYMQHYITVYWL